MGLNPGITEVVAFLNDNGFTTCDSGDGVTHDFDCDREGAYVVVQIEDKSILIGETDRLVSLLSSLRIDISQIGEDASVTIQSTYDPADGTCFIDIAGLSDDVLVAARKKLS